MSMVSDNNQLKQSVTSFIKDIRGYKHDGFIRAIHPLTKSVKTLSLKDLDIKNVIDLNNENYGIYFSLANYTKGINNDPVTINILVVDIDYIERKDKYVNEEDVKKFIFSQMQSMKDNASDIMNMVDYVVNTGYGMHIYFKLDNELPVHKFKYYQKLLIAYMRKYAKVNADKRITNPTRIMRMPGFYNTKFRDATSSNALISRIMYDRRVTLKDRPKNNIIEFLDLHAQDLEISNDKKIKVVKTKSKKVKVIKENQRKEIPTIHINRKQKRFINSIVNRKTSYIDNDKIYARATRIEYLKLKEIYGNMVEIITDRTRRKGVLKNILVIAFPFQIDNYSGKSETNILPEIYREIYDEDIYSGIHYNCKFHNEKNSSMVYYSDDDTLHCFGCGATFTPYTLIEYAVKRKLISKKKRYVLLNKYKKELFRDSRNYNKNMYISYEDLECKISFKQFTKIRMILMGLKNAGVYIYKLIRNKANESVFVINSVGHETFMFYNTKEEFRDGLVKILDQLNAGIETIPYKLDQFIDQIEAIYLEDPKSTMYVIKDNKIYLNMAAFYGIGNLRKLHMVIDEIRRLRITGYPMFKKFAWNCISEKNILNILNYKMKTNYKSIKYYKNIIDKYFGSYLVSYKGKRYYRFDEDQNLNNETIEYNNEVNESFKKIINNKLCNLIKRIYKSAKNSSLYYHDGFRDIKIQMVLNVNQLHEKAKTITNLYMPLYYLKFYKSKMFISNGKIQWRPFYETLMELKKLNMNIKKKDDRKKYKWRRIKKYEQMKTNKKETMIC